MIDLHDVVLVLTILSKMSDEMKLRRNTQTVVFELTDVDEDGCLSPEEIARMIEVIQKVLNRENSDIKIKSKVLLDQLSQDKARRVYEWAMKTIGNLEEKCEREEGLITFQEFYDTLLLMPSLKQSFLPRNTGLKNILRNTQAEREYTVSSQFRDDFVMFRYEMHSLMTSNLNLESDRRSRKASGKSYPISSYNSAEGRPSSHSQGPNRNDSSTAQGHPKHSQGIQKQRPDHSAFPDKSEVFRTAGAGILGTSQAKTKGQKNADFQRKECPGIIKSADKLSGDSNLPTQIWEFINIPNKTYVRKPVRASSPSIEVELKSRKEARLLMVPKSLAVQALEEISQEMAKTGSKKSDKAEEVSLVDTDMIKQKENDRLKSIPRYVVEKWSKVKSLP